MRWSTPHVRLGVATVGRGERCGRGRSADCASEARSADWYELIPEHSGAARPRRARLRHQVTCSPMLRHYIAILHVCQCVCVCVSSLQSNRSAFPHHLETYRTLEAYEFIVGVLSGWNLKWYCHVRRKWFLLSTYGNNSARKTWSTCDLNGWKLGLWILEFLNFQKLKKELKHYQSQLTN